MYHVNLHTSSTVHISQSGRMALIINVTASCALHVHACSACSDSSDSGEPPADPAPYKITTSDAAQTVRRQASQAPPPKEPRPHLEEYQLHTAAEERALLSEEVSQCLHTSLHHWQLAAGCYCPPLEAALSSSSGGAGLDRLGEVCHSLLLTAEVCCAHKLVSDAAVICTVLYMYMYMHL